MLFKDMKLERIPDQYVVGRWTHDASVRLISHTTNLSVDHTAKVEAMAVMVNQLWGDFYRCIGLVEGNMEQVLQL